MLAEYNESINVVQRTKKFSFTFNLQLIPDWRMHFIIGVSCFRKHFKTTATQCNYIPDDGDENTNIKIAIFLKILLYF